jgi:tetratricopeptide (TPR) repeat protein
MALAHEQKGDIPQAISELQKAVSTSKAPLYRALLGQAYGLAGNRTKALEMLSDLKVESKSRYVSPVDMALIYTGLGDRDSAFAWLEGAYQERAMRVQELPDPTFRNLRTDPRSALVSGGEIVLPHPRLYWGETGNVNMRPWLNLHLQRRCVFVLRFQHG